MPALVDTLLSAVRHRNLIRTLGRRELAARYRGSVLGRAWPVLSPLLMLAVYTFVFGSVFRARWPGLADSGLASFALVLMAGLLLNSLMSELLGRAPDAVLQHPNYVKKVVFPLETLVWVDLGVALFHCVVGFGLLLLANAVFGTGLHAAALALPLLLLPFCLLLVGLAWTLSALGVYLRDLGQVIGPALTALMFMSPIFYPRSIAPEALQGALALNPLTFVVEQVRAAMFQGQWPDWAGWCQYLAVSLVAYGLGLAIFQKCRKGFADVL